MYAYCENNPVMYVDCTGENSEALNNVLITWFVGGGAVAWAEPTLVGEVVYVITSAALLVGICLVSLSSSEAQTDVEDAPNSITEKSDVNEFRSKEEADPNRRPKQKKQGRENKSESRLKDDWESRNNRRDGRNAKPPKKHTPGKDHKKHSHIDIFERVC